ncbi:acyltransferase family protein [Pseudomonas grandcourensis]|uniref:acyltransferase family protein n=1 Tax=Pseudomonas grandcourensis TaxID=3136736 RepID=UPI0032657910
MRSSKSISDVYRPDIDGLRAIAVLSVVLYHAGLNVFSGGFVGVDIFFVISGFLITRLLLNEIEEKGKLDFGRFYLRRARRLLPAFFFTLTFSGFFAVLVFSPQLLESFGGSLINAVFSISNIYFFSNSGYFDTASALKPLLHTWSLGVEEQFYVLWPIFLCLLAPRKWLAPVTVVVVGLISLCFAQTMLAKQPDAVFFLMPFRVFEFSIGAITVWLLRVQIKNKVALEFLFCGGVALLVYSIFFYSEKTQFPGVNALLPCVGAALCIYAGSVSFAGKLLSNRLFVAIGLISYSLYLAHWPVIVFYKYCFGGSELSTWEACLLTVASFAIAIFMYFCIEKPFRRTRATNSNFLTGGAFVALSISFLAVSMWAQEGWGWRDWATSGSISTEIVKNGKEQRFKIRQEICVRKGWAECDSLISGRVNALILGDSHAIDALNAFEKIYPDHSFVMSELGGCPPYRDIEKITQPNYPNRENCKKLNASRFDVEYLRKFDYIVINLLFTWYTPEYLREYLDFLKENEIKRVVVIGDYLVMKKDMYELLNEYGFNSKALSEWVDRSKSVESVLRSEVSEEGYFYLSKRAALCNGDVCEIFDGNKVPFTYDKDHLSYEFAARLAVGEKDSLDQYLGFNGKREAGTLSGAAKAAATVVKSDLRSVHPAKVSMISLIPASISSCQGAATVKVRWDAHGQSGVGQTTEVWVRDVNGKEKLFFSGHNAGEGITGSWARPGILFTLKDASNGAVLDSVELEGQACVRS